MHNRRMRSLAFTMTIDPDGAMHDWVDLPDGWTLTRVPSQEAVHVIGVRAYQELLVELCAVERPHALVTHPPYDWLTPDIGKRLRKLGTRVIGYAFDDEIFARSYDLQTIAALRRTYDRYVTTHDVPWATAPLAPIDERPPEHDVVLVGRAYARRRELVAALEKEGLRVVTRGDGWPGGPVTRAGMRELYARAAIVLTTADWESHEVAMVKHRLLDTAMLGAFQIAQAAPDLRRYFPEEEVPSYRNATDLVVTVKAALADPEGRRRSARAARRRALGEHTWRVRLPSLLADVPLRAPRPSTERRALVFDQLLLALATRAEASGRSRAAGALYREVISRDATEPTALAGLGRCLRDEGAIEESIEFLRRAVAVESPSAAAALYAALPSFGVGTGLGRLGLLPPSAEALALLVAGLVELERVAEALAVLDGVTSPALQRALAATLRPDDDPAHAVIGDRLARWRTG